MGLGRVISERWKRMSQAESADPADTADTADPPPGATGPRAAAEPGGGDAALLALWVDLVADWRTAEPHAGDTPPMQRVVALEQRLATASGRPDPALTADLAASLRELTLPPLARLRQHIAELSGGSRTYQRAASAHQLKLTHLQDEVARCRAMIEQECRRRGITLTSKPVNDDNLHDLLYQVFKAISHMGSQRMQAAGSDPIIAEIERLIASEDPAAVEAFPAWLRAPAARILAVVQERNRYKRLLANHGLLAPE